MNELIVIFGMGLAAGMAVGILVMICYAAYRIKVIMNQLDQHIEEVMDTTLMGVTVEHYDGMYRLYQANTNQFICQGTTLAEIRTAFNQLFPTKTCYIAGGDSLVVEQLKQELQASPAESK
jgi:hypothetical protein